MTELKRLYNYLKKNNKKKILFLTTSNRWSGDKELPKSSIIAEEIMKKLGSDRCQIINVAKLKIFSCEGNVSTKRGNTCGLKDAILKDKICIFRLKITKIITQPFLEQILTGYL